MSATRARRSLVNKRVARVGAEALFSLPPNSVAELLPKLVQKQPPQAVRQLVLDVGQAPPASCDAVAAVLVPLYNWAQTEPTTRDPGCGIRQAIIEVLGNLEVQAALAVVRLARGCFGVQDLSPSRRGARGACRVFRGLYFT